jgi:hypothetical protein
MHSTQRINEEPSWFRSYSSFSKLVRTTAYCIRFMENCKLKKDKRKSTFITVEELKGAETKIIKIIQQEEFPDEYTALKKGNSIKTTSKLLSLHPFLDKTGCLRIGGRLENANLKWDRKHQIILPPKNHITNLIIRRAHLTILHGGEQKTLYFLRQKFWPPEHCLYSKTASIA